jgi:hypothetical protein
METNSLVGRQAFRRDLYCSPKEVGHCTIIAASTKGPEWVVVEWSGEAYHHKAGDVDVVRVIELDVR